MRRVAGLRGDRRGGRCGRGAKLCRVLDGKNGSQKDPEGAGD